MKELKKQIFSCILLVPVMFMVVHDILPHHHHNNDRLTGVECSVGPTHKPCCESDIIHNHPCDSDHSGLENCEACHFDSELFINKFNPDYQYFVRGESLTLCSLQFVKVKHTNSDFVVPDQKMQDSLFLRGPPSFIS